MRKWVQIIMMGFLAGTCSLSWAQTTWRCSGNYFTNNADEARQIGNCKPLNGEGLTVISSPPPREGETTQQNDSTRQRDEAQRQQERVRAQQRANLQTQLSQRQQELAALEAEYNNGEPARLGSERNYQRYLDRVERLKGEIAQKRAEIEKIRQQLDGLDVPSSVPQESHTPGSERMPS